jgi:hypothetical protein
VFIKAIGPETNPDTPAIHRREARITALLPAGAPVPRLLWSYDEGEGGWVALVLEEIDGHNPAQPWRDDELHRVLDAMAVLSDTLTPSPLPHDVIGTAGDHFEKHICGWRQLLVERDAYLPRIDPWSIRHLEKLAQIEADVKAAADGNTLLNLDVRADNILLTPDRVWFVDWPHARLGAAWIEVLCFAPSVHMQGGPPPEEVIVQHPACRAADPAAINAVLVAIAGYFTLRSLQPPPPGIPTVRAFQAAQGVVSREWLAQRTGWT